ncbi:hypothetical protein PARA125_001451 [Parachlamydia sp. AcF125]|nr:hypothetical protein [Parachlamydia sp. AcF125]
MRLTPKLHVYLFMQAIFLDLETTGLDWTKHVVIDIAFKVVDLSKNQIRTSFQKLIKHPPEIWEKTDPISLEINGYTREQVEGGDASGQIREEIIALFTQLGIIRGQAIFICQNPSFDRPFFNQLVDTYTQEQLNWPYHWLDLASMYWTKRIELWRAIKESIPQTMSLSKDAIANFYHLPPEDSPHRAMNGVNHLLLCYQALFGVKFAF